MTVETERACVFYSAMNATPNLFKAMKLDYLFKGFLVYFLLIMSPTVPASAHALKPENPVDKAVLLQNRLDEIKALDKSTLTHSEKKMLRREVKEIKKELATASGGVYLSVGAILLIALLLILLL
jgi:hypothetical protein